MIKIIEAKKERYNMKKVFNFKKKVFYIKTFSCIINCIFSIDLINRIDRREAFLFCLKLFLKKT